MQDPQDSTSAPASAPAQALPEAQAPVLNPVDENWARKTLVDLAFANLKEQQSQRHWKLGMRLVWVFFLGFLVWQVVSLNSPATHTSFPHTALVTVLGEIGPDTEASAENVMTAMRTGSIGAVTPYRYSRLLFGISIGVLVFGEQLDAPMLLGCAIVIGAGLFIGWQNQRRQPAQ